MATDSTTRASAPRPSLPPGRLVGRTRLARNLLGRLSRGQSLLLSGGPKLGKTTLLAHLYNQLHGERPGAAAYLDLAQARDAEATASTTRGARYLLADNADPVIAEPSSRILESLRGQGFHAIVWAVGGAWRDVAAADRDLRLHPVPLAVLLPNEARELVRPELTAEQMDWVLSHGGTHPYVLLTLRGMLLQARPEANRESVFHAAVQHLAPCFAACVGELRRPSEARLLDYLVRTDAPVSPAAAARALGVEAVKRDGDVLSQLGLISRWNLNEGARLHASCHAFNAWYRAQAAGAQASS